MAYKSAITENLDQFGFRCKNIRIKLTKRLLMHRFYSKNSASMKQSENKFVNITTGSAPCFSAVKEKWIWSRLEFTELLVHYHEMLLDTKSEFVSQYIKCGHHL